MTDPARSVAEQDGAVGALGRDRGERHLHIIDTVNREGFASVDELARQLEVSRMTIHRDLAELHRLRVLRKVRGGASAHRSTQFESNLQFRSQAALPEKQRIAAAAATLLAEGEVVILDDSTTVAELVPAVIRSAPATVITNFLPSLQLLAAEPELEVIALGGQFHIQYQAYLGPLCEMVLGQLHADAAFLSTSAMKGTELFHQDQQLVAVKRAMLRAADRRVLLMDHTKIGPGALHRLCGVEEFTHAVVDAGVADDAREAIEALGVELIVA